MEHDSAIMDLAFAEAEAAAGRGEVPVGAVLVEAETGRVLARDGNRTEERADPTAHAGLNALEPRRVYYLHWRDGRRILPVL